MLAHGDFIVGGGVIEEQALELLKPNFVEECKDDEPYPYRVGAGSFFARAERE